MLVSMRFWVSEQGGLVDAADARVSVLDHGFTVADGVFETLKVTDGVAFALTRHLDRLSRSASLMGLPSPDPTIVRSAVEQTIEANAAHLTGLARLRITYTAGVAPLGSDRGESGTTLVVALSPMSAWPDSTAVVTVAWPRNERGALAGEIGGGWRGGKARAKQHHGHQRHQLGFDIHGQGACEHAAFTAALP